MFAAHDSLELAFRVGDRRIALTLWPLLGVGIGGAVNALISAGFVWLVLRGSTCRIVRDKHRAWQADAATRHLVRVLPADRVLLVRCILWQAGFQGASSTGRFVS